MRSFPLYRRVSSSFVQEPHRILVRTTAAALLAVAALLSSCAAAGAGSGSEALPPTVDSVVFAGIPQDAWTSIEQNSFSSGDISSGSARYEAYYLLLIGYSQAQTVESLLQMMLTGWDESGPAVYKIGNYTFSWSRSGNSWTWNISYVNLTRAGANVYYVVTITATAGGWDISMTQNGNSWITGSVTAGGTSGNAALSDPSGSYSGTVTAVWKPSTSPYDFNLKVTGTGDFALLSGNNATTAMVVLDTDLAGNNYAWSYYENGGSSPVAWDQYPPT
ncbi:hypothetical protein [Salinispira pacifica]